ncbi:hypothetical protein ABZ345_29855 [Lentzea sp. NPDC005914]|uniref:hypothetical protein n=1 Tax=Lentzea sp. NPDC005914 TaxID=3154572 RepID=UPI0034091A3D
MTATAVAPVAALEALQALRHKLGGTGPLELPANPADVLGPTDAPGPTDALITAQEAPRHPEAAP